MNLPPPASNRAVFKLLWKAARLRAAGRRQRQRELMQHKKGDSSDALAGLAMIGMALFMAVLHGALGWTLVGTLESARTMDVESRGKLVLGRYDFLLERLTDDQSRIDDLESQLLNHPDNRRNLEKKLAEARSNLEVSIDSFTSSAAQSRKHDIGGSLEANERLVEEQFRKFGAAGFISEKDLPEADLRHPETVPASYWPFVAFIILWWIVMMVFQGEGLEMDIQRRRHPMWEWLFSHPVRPVAAFAADMLSPLMANPVYFSAPVFWMVVLGKIHGVFGALVGGIAIGMAFAVAASCLNKAMEVCAMIRLSPRNRGAILGLMSWLGYAAMMLPLFTMQAPALKVMVVKKLAWLASWIPLWPVRALTIGWGDTPDAGQAILSALVPAGLLLATAVTVAWWGMRRGLQGGESSGVPAPPVVENDERPRIFASNPLFRKELLWFWRDKGAVVQAILIPLTIASFQLFNLRGLLDNAVSHWNGVCGAAVICGTYFLLVLGPRSLSSEGGALWIAMTWPQGMEDLLKAKARLWWMLSNLIVGFILIAAVFMFPAHWWRIALVAVGWCVFGRGLAEKTVTLVTAPSSSGEPEPVPRGRQWAAMVGTLAFGSGVITQTWDTAMMGVVFSSLAAAAIWQNFRARLPYLFDPWSEKLPPAPSLMHAMIGIAVMVEALCIISGIAVGFGGMDCLWQTRAIAYGLVGFTAWIFMNQFLSGRGVKAADIWKWERGENPPDIFVACGGAVFAGTAMGSMALFYVMGLKSLPLTHDWMVAMEKITVSQENYKAWIFLLAVGMAPFAEEYFFRGLLFRALDREWGGLKAMVGSAAYFAMYHPPVSWIPVFAVGVSSAWLFKKSGSLIPCVLLHMAYNAVVVGLG
jgi:membrane protease YdiL (CAAX protease family)